MHEIRIFDYEYDYASTENGKKSIICELNETAKRCSDAGGLYEPIQWKINKVFNSYEEAEDYLYNLPSYANMAVSYYIKKETAKTKLLRQKLFSVESEIRNFTRISPFQSVKTAFVTCPNCKSHLNREYLVNCYPMAKCPLCKGELVTKAYTNKLNKLKKKQEDFKQKLHTEINKSANVKKMVMVKIEYHC